MQCHAKCKATGQQCRRRAVEGFSVCQVHGAGSKKHPGGRPIKTGLHSKVLRKKLAKRVAKYLGNENLCNLRVNIALKRALLDELFARRSAEKKRLNIATINNASQLLNSISQDIERLDKLEHGVKHTISIHVLQQTVSVIIGVLDQEINNEKIKERIFRKLAEYGLGPNSGTVGTAQAESELRP